MNQPVEAPRVLLLLRHQLATYSQTLQRLGQFVLEQPQRVLYLTITELARESGTSEASVTRLCRGVGCRGYTEFKMALALETQQEQSSQHQASATSAFSTLIEESVAALRDTGALVSQQALLQSAELLEKARQIQIYGVAASAIIGEYLAYRLLRMGISAQQFSDMHRAAMNATSLKPGDVVIAVSSSGSTKDLLHAVQLGKEHGASIIVLSNTSRSPLATQADQLLVAAKPEGPLTAGSFHSKISAMLVIELLSQHLLENRPELAGAISDSAKATLPWLI
ncbi:TPA: MurR/RpiR family transcriptional regulator [Aeromonas veronii]|uniref:MurR/RpiR family transcriptional regulator n=1 Tax=Aeromonas veronii TaxID=654 RepID=UPI0033116079|nr:MurR/RpiR family transcriptional regulator [Aeromonas veronii]HDO1335693.1 MurR/RpiR family transcriptional regulator [Aeromonas veronii]HDO1340151.1 MurR/RpiR family transcriptional regulator [Aeromonas veronii]HDO1344654.1 MurR/RpiR family transcriptional regulator [Aeromonas veronii]HDO1349252.1 MurR/RpiR family transcriptional regulator [Aeromonas veronii]